MADSILVRDVPAKSVLSWGRVLGIVGTVLGVTLTLVQHPLGSTVLAIFGPVFLAAESAWMLGCRRRLWVQDLGSGFVLRDPRGSREFRDDEVVAASLETVDHFQEALIARVTQKLSLWIDSMARPIVMTAHLEQGSPNPLRDLWVRLFTELESKSRGALAQGGEVRGDGWRLDRTQLSLESRGERIPLKDLTAQRVIEERLCLWTQGESPIARIPIHSRNAQILCGLLETEIAGRTTARQDSVPGLGRLLYEHRLSRWRLARIAVLALILAGGGVLIWNFQQFLGGGLLVFSGLLAASFAHHLFAAFRWYERGIVLAGLTGSSQLRFDQLQNFRFALSKMFYKGSYSHLDYRFEFEPSPDSGMQPLIFTASVRRASDDGLNQLADYLGGLLVNDMAARLNAGERVRWIGDVVFTPQGLEYPDPVSRAIECLPYSSLRSDAAEKGVILARDNNRLIFRVLDTGDKHFMAGHFLLARLLASQASAAK